MGTNGAQSSSVLAELDTMVQRAKEEIDRLELVRRDVDDQLHRLRRFVKSADEKNALPRTKAKDKRHGTTRYSAATRARVARGMLEAQEPFTAKDVLALVKINEPTLYIMLRDLRDEEVVGKAGKVQGKGTTPSNTWRILDRRQLEAYANVA